ncbi:MAG TPA: DUF72 domain-containing protein [Gaiellaceae bacterium]|nr:DUF72 domain-containing protein [Gaiellaceae bacterium]
MREDRDSTVRVGCSGWNYGHWRNGVFYPPRLAAHRWLDYYARFYDTVEINMTFYRLPKVEVVQRWVDGSRDDFLFAVKVSRYLTHIKRLRDPGDGLATFLERIEPLRRSPKMGPLLWQLPPDFKRDDERLAAALERLPPGRHCFEFRHESWFVDEIFELLRSHDVALVIGDDPRRPFQSLDLTADWTFVRFHGGSELGTGDYSERELERWAERVAGFGVPAYVYFNNDWGGYAIHNALRFKELLGLQPAVDPLAVPGVPA